MRLRKLLVPAVVVALGVSACGGDNSSSADETPAGEGEDSSASEGESGEEETDTGGSGSEVDAAELFGAISDAVVEAGSYEFESTTDAGGQEVTVAGAIQVATEISESNMRIQSDVMGASTGPVLIVDGQFFIEAKEGLPSGTWITVDPEGSNPFFQQNRVISDSIGPRAASVMFDDIGSARDLTAQLAEHPDLLTVTEVGGATVDGVEATEYLVTVNDIAAFQDVPEDQVQIDEQAFRMWIDSDNLPRRYVTEAGNGPSNMTFSNYGVDVEVQAPPEDEVVYLSEFLSQNQGG